MQRADSLEKTLMLRKIEGRRRRGQQRLRCLDGVSESVDMSLRSHLMGSVQFSYSVVLDSLCPLGLQHARLPVHHQLPEFTQTHVHWGGNSIQPSHPLSSPSPPALNPSQHQGLFTGHQSIRVSASTSVLPMNTQDWSPLGWTGWISLPSKGLSRVFSNTTVQKHRFFSAQFSL